MAYQPTLLELAYLSDAAYGDAAAITWLSANGWTPVVGNPQYSDPSTNYHGVAYEKADANGNETIVIANRGTVSSSFKNLYSDAQLATTVTPKSAISALTYAERIVDNAPKSATIIETGHSLGGYEAQYVLAKLVDNNISPNASAVTFNAPGLSSTNFKSAAASYNVLNIYAQGDVIHDAGGQHLGATRSIAAGPSTLKEMADVAAGVVGAIGLGGFPGVAIGGSLLVHDYLKAHLIATTISDLSAGGGDASIGGESAQSFISSGSGSTSSSMVSASGSSVTLSNSSGDSITLNESSGQETATMTVGTDGLFGSAASASALNGELTADGQVTVQESLSSQLLSSLSGGSGIYATASNNGGASTEVSLGQSPPGLVTGGSSDISVSGNTPSNRYDYNVPSNGLIAAETILGGNGVGTVWVNNSGQYAQLTGGTPSATAAATWTDTNGTTYVFQGLPGEAIGTLVISNGALGTNTSDSITIQNFNIETAITSSFLGIHLNPGLTITAGATLGVDPPATFASGSSEPYTISVAAPSNVAQVVSLTLSDAASSDFDAIVAGQTLSLGAAGSFQVTIPAGATSVAFGLVDTSSDSGASDLVAGSNLQLTATMTDAAGDTVSAGLTITYQPRQGDTSAAPQPTDVIVGNYDSVTGITTYAGDGGNDNIAATGSANLVVAQNSGNDIIIGGPNTNTIYGGTGNDVVSLAGGAQDLVYVGDWTNYTDQSEHDTVIGSATGSDTILSIGEGTAVLVANGATDIVSGADGTNEIFAGAVTSLANAISQASTATGTGLQGDYLSVGDGDNTIIGSNGNDFITTDDEYASGYGGNDVVVMGGGNDVYFGGVDQTIPDGPWSVTFNNGSLDLNNIPLSAASYAGSVGSYLQPYNGILVNGNQVGWANNVDIFGGTGNDLMELGNGGNYVDMGSGNSTVYAGVGNDTIIAGSGNDLISGGGGNEYVAGGSGHDTITGGDGSNTLLGGSGNSTITADSGGLVGSYTGATLEQNYVSGGSGNDVIYGSSGSDTLVAGTGNSTIYGGSGNEWIVGGSGNDVLAANLATNATVVAGGSGNDSLYGGSDSVGSYYLYGGNGSDYLAGNEGNLVMSAGDGGTASAPTYVFASQTDSTSQATIYGGLGVDSLTGGVGNTVIYAGDGGTASAPTNAYASSGNTTIYGGLGTDDLQGGSGTDVIYAGDGGTSSAPTTVVAGSGVATLIGGAGDAILQDAVSGQDLIVGGAGNESLVGYGNDTMVAGSGNDVIQNNSGTQTVEINAGFGTDALDFNGGTSDNLVFGTGIAPTDFSGEVALDQNNNPVLILSGDGGSISLSNAFGGGLGTITFADSGSVTAQTLISDAFSGDQTFTNGTQTFILTVGNGELVQGTTTGGDTIAAYGASANISGGSGSTIGSAIYAGGSADQITSDYYAPDTINAAGNSDTIASYYSDHITVSGSGSVVQEGATADTVTASGSNDTIVGAGGSSLLYINNSSTVVQAQSGAGVDTIISSVSYSAPINVNILELTGSASLVATGNAGADKLIGSSGSDTLVAGVGPDTLTAGTGNTTFVINSASDVVVDAYSASNTVQSTISYSLIANINTLVLNGTASLTGSANAANDTLISNNGVDTLVGGAGADNFVINNAADVILSAGGNSTVTSSVSYALSSGVNILALAGTSNLEGSANGANDTLVSNSGVDTLVGGTGNDLFIVGNAADIVQDTSSTASNIVEASVSYTLSTDVNTLVLTGASALVGAGNGGADSIVANAGADTLVAGAGADTLVGGAGADTFIVNSGTDVVLDSSTTSLNTIESSVSYLLPTNVNTLILTGSTNIAATANSGADTLVSNTGIDTLVGGSGRDTFVVNNSSDVISDTASGVSNIVESSVSYSLANNVNMLQLTGSANLIGTTNSGNDLVTGNAGADTLVATSGTDTLMAGIGVDTLEAGIGTTLFIVNNSSDVVSVGGSHGSDTIESSVSFTLPVNVNALVLTGSANLSGVALSGNNSLIGNAGSDTLTGGSGNDTLVAGSGPTTLIGGSGTDTFVVNSTSDVIENIKAGDVVITSAGYTMPTGVNTLTLVGAGELVVGNASTDAVTANDTNDTLVAGSGVATFTTGVNADSDTFVINNAADVVDVTEGSNHIIDSSVSYTLPVNVTTLQLTGSAGISGAANTGHDPDLLIGNAGNDSLIAGGGADTLQAGAGIDTLIAGSGADTFVVDNTADVISDTVSDQNSAVVSSVGFTLPSTINTLTLTGSGNLKGAANAGNDTLTSNAGIDTLTAGSGTDVFIINNSADVVQSVPSTNTDTVLAAVSYTAPTNVNVLALTGWGNLSATGNAAADSLIAGNGSDTLVAGGGQATLVGGTGNDTFVVNSTADVVLDTFSNRINSLYSSVNYTLPTNVNALVLTGSANVTGVANAGNDTLTSNFGVDTLVGAAGNDTFLINNGADVVVDTSGTAANTVDASVSYSLAGNVNSLWLTGTSNLTGIANSANDTLTSNQGVDTLVGGSGNDVFVINNTADVVQDSTVGANNSVVAGVSFTLPVDVNTLTLTGTAALMGTGNAVSDVLAAGSGADTLVSGSAVSTLIGGAGNDTFVVNNVGDVVEDSVASSTNTIDASVSYSLLTDINTLVLTGTSALMGTANAANDTLISNTGVDTLVGGSGSDVFIVNNSADVIQNINASDTIEASVNYSLPAGASELLLIGSANISATGGTGFYSLIGGAGTDTLITSNSSDTLVGGSGNTTFVMSSPYDFVVDSYSNTSNTVESAASFSLPTNVDTLILTGSGNVVGTGNTDATNVLSANSGNNSLTGIADSTTINGGSGSDTLYAGPIANVINVGSGGTSSAPTYVIGNDSLTSILTNTTVNGGSGVEVIDGGPGSDYILGGAGAETINSGSGFDTVVAGTGSEWFEDTNGGSSTYVFDQSGFGTDTLGWNPQGAPADAALAFGTGIEPGSVTVTATGANSIDGEMLNLLDFITADGAIEVAGGLLPNDLSSISFADGSTESLAQFFQNDGLGTISIAELRGSDIVSTQNDQTVGGGGNTYNIYAFGNDDLVGTAQYSVYAYGDGDTVLAAASADDQGSNGLIELSAGGIATIRGANDTVQATTGATVYVYDPSTIVQASTWSSSSAVYSTASYSLPTNIQNLMLDGADLAGTSNATGGLLYANGAYDTLYGGAGADTLLADADDDVLVGGAGAETYVLGSPTDSIVFGTGAASVTAVDTYSNYTLPSNADILSVYGAMGAGNAGPDLLEGSYATLVGGSGSDTFQGSGSTTLIGGSGNDTFIARAGDVVIDTFTTGTNILIGSSWGTNYTLPSNVNTLALEGWASTATGNAANDVLEDESTGANNGYIGNNTLIAGAGNDTLIANTSDTIVINSTTSHDSVVAAASTAIDFGANVAESSLTFSVSAGASGAPNALVISETGGGSITIAGALVPGNISALNFSNGASLSVAQALGTIKETVAGASGNLIVSTYADDSILGGSGQDTIYAWGTGDTLTAGTGGSTIFGAGSSDQITGGAATDYLGAAGTNSTLTAGSGQETLAVNDPSDVVVVSSGASTDTVLSSVSYTVPAHVSVMELTGTANVLATANSLNDTIVGNQGYDTLWGGTGSDVLTGTSSYQTWFIAGSGPETLSGAGQWDVFDVANTSDVVQESYSGKNIYSEVNAGFNYTLPANVAKLYLESANLVGTGNASTDVLTAEAQGDTLVAGSGNALLVDSGNGYDVLVGGSGADTLNGTNGRNASNPINDTLISGTGVDVIEGSAASLIEINNSLDTLVDIDPGVTAGLESSVNYVIDNSNFSGDDPSTVYLTLTGSANLTAGYEDSNLLSTGFFVYANSGNDSLIGQSDYNYFYDGTGIDTLVGGGSGTYNSFTVSNASDVIVAQAAASNLVMAYVSYTCPTNVQQLEVVAGLLGVANSGSDTLESNGNDTLVAGSGTDVLESYGGGNDTYVAGSGSDTMMAWSSDLLLFNVGFGSTDATIIGGTTGTPVVEFGSGISGSNLTASAVFDAAGNGALAIADGASVITLSGALSGQTYNFSLPGQGTLSLAQFLALVNVSTGSVSGSAGTILLEGASATAITAGSGNETIFAAGAGDTVTGGSGTQGLYAVASADLIVGGSGSDTLEGLGAYDTLSGGSVADTMIGGTGATVDFVVNNSSDVISLQSSPGIDTVTASASYSLPTGISSLTLTGTAALTGTANGGSDTLVSNTGVDTLVGGGGSDVFILNNASDVVTDTSTTASNSIQTGFSYSLPTDVNTLVLTGTAALTGHANSGTDTLISNAGLDTLIGGSGNDTFVLNNAADVVQDTSTTATNTIQVGANYTLPTDINVLVLTGTGNVAGTANSGTDTLTSNSGVDTLVGGAGNDTFIVNNAADVVQDTSTTATNTIKSVVSFVLPTDVNGLVLTGTGNLTGAANSGTDTLTANTGIDTLVGGTGNDTFVIGNSADVVQDTSTTSTNVASSAVSYSLAANVNTLTLTGSAAIVGTGNAGNDSITGNTGHDTLVAGSGVDTLTAGSGVSTLIGGAGNDTFVINNTGDVVTDTYTSTSNVLRSSVAYTLPANINSLVLTGTAALKGVANGGNDTLTSNSGVDTLVGGSGNETFVVGNASDVVQDTWTTASNVISASVAFTLPTDVNTLTFTGTAALKGTGNSGNDLMTANTGADTLVAGNGTDTLVSGSAGTDSLVAGTGSDLFIVNLASDVVTVGSSHGTDTIDSAVTYTASANVADLVLTGTASIAGTGNSLAGLLIANSGNDTLTAGSGADTLAAGAGNDLFVVNSASDVVQDTYTTTNDSISSSVAYTLPTNVNWLAFSGTSALKGTANSGNDTLVSNTGADTFVGGAGNDTFVISATSDVITDTYTSTSNTLSSSVSYSLPTNVNTLLFTGTSALKGTANSGNDSLTGNTGADTLVAGSGADTLVAMSTAVATSLVGGAGNDTFVISYASDVVTDTSTTATNTLRSSVSFTLPTDVNTLVLTGTAALKGTANSGTDTLTSNTGLDTLVGSTGNDTFVVNNSSDVVTDTSTTATNTLDASVSFTLPTDVNTLVLTGTAAITGTGNSHTDSLTANSGSSTLVAGSGVATMIGGAGNDTFVINSTSDVITDTYTSTSNTLSSSVSYSLSTNVNSLLFTGTAALKGTANSGNDLLTANAGADTLVAGSGTDTLVAGTSGADSLVAGTGTDLFEVNSTADVVSVSTTGNDTIQSSVNYTLPTDVQYLLLSGTASLTGTGNSLTDLIVGNSGNDTLTGGTGVDVLEGGKTAGQDLLQASSNQAALVGGAAASTLTGGAYKDFYAAGAVSDTITTGATSNVIAVNKGDGADTLQPTSGASNILSLGGGIDTESLYFSKSGNNLVLTDGVTGDSVTFTNWYVGSVDQNITKLQVIEIASASYNASGSDALRNEAVEEFNFSSLVTAFNNAGSPSNWALSNAMSSAQLTGSSTAAYGGDLAYYEGLNGNLTGMDLSAAQSTLTNSSYATATQTIDAWSSISGGSSGTLVLAEKVQGVTTTRAVASSDTTSTATTSDTTSTGTLPTVEVDPLRTSGPSTIAIRNIPQVRLSTGGGQDDLTRPMAIAHGPTTTRDVLPTVTPIAEKHLVAIRGAASTTPTSSEATAEAVARLGIFDRWQALGTIGSTDSGGAESDLAEEAALSERYGLQSVGLLSRNRLHQDSPRMMAAIREDRL